MAGGWGAPERTVPAVHPCVVFAAARRDELSSRFPGETLVVPSGRAKGRAGDCDHPFRPGSDYMYLVGAPGPDHVLVMQPIPAGGHRAVVYLPPREDRSTPAFFEDLRDGELWAGPRLGLREVAESYLVESAPLQALPLALAVAGSVRVLPSVDPYIDGLCAPDGRGSELASVLADMRLIKDSYEIARLEEAVSATVRGFEDVRGEIAAATRARRGERWLEGTFWRRARAEGNDAGSSAVVASGAHCATPYWQPKDGRVRAGDLLLLDMGVETDAMYTAEITRTVPVSGRFTPEQRQVYEVVFRAQQAALDAVRPGMPFFAPHRAAMAVCVDFLLGLGVVAGRAEAILEQQLHQRWTLHATSHHLGLDVPDCTEASPDRYADGVLEEGMVITVGPGLYFQPDDELVPSSLRGMGVRIEDDVVVSASGARILSGALPRSPDDVEAWMARGRRP
jgi:Xaa-Pro aminopeptidase